MFAEKGKEPSDHGSRRIPKEIEVEILLRNLTKDESSIQKKRSIKPPTEKLAITVGQAQAKLLQVPSVSFYHFFEFSEI